MKLKPAWTRGSPGPILKPSTTPSTNLVRIPLSWLVDLGVNTAKQHPNDPQTPNPAQPLQGARDPGDALNPLGRQKGRYPHPERHAVPAGEGSSPHLPRALRRSASFEGPLGLGLGFGRSPAEGQGLGAVPGSCQSRAEGRKTPRRGLYLA